MPRNVTVSIGDNKMMAESVQVIMNTKSDLAGVPKMGSTAVSIRAIIDFHDEANVGYGKLSSLFDLAYVPNQDDIKDIKITFWQDNTQQQALVAYKFQGWIARYETSHQLANSAQPTQFNHVMVLDLQPKLNQKGSPELTISNG